jgi:very-short-patch-repair endonuclease
MAPGWPDPDLSYPDLRIAIEYDGDHYLTTRQWRSDRARRSLLEDAGWIVLEFTADDVWHRPQETVERVRRAIASRAVASGAVVSRTAAAGR